MSDDRYIDWIETDLNQYAGEYVYFEFKGSEVKRQENLTIVVSGEIMVTYTEKNKEPKSRKSVLIRNEFRLNFKGLTGKARFVKRLPPPNAKGHIESGILVNNKFFSFTGDSLVGRI